LVWSVVCEEAEVLDLAVTTAARRQRIAHALLAACMEAASQQGAERLLLEVRAGNTGAQAFYAAEGFQPLARRKAYYPAAHPSAAREDALILVRPL
jgi:ribosomal-protein-alanine N-acetyltransferase